MNTENLLKLAAKLDRLPKSYQHFDMSMYVSDGSEPNGTTRAVVNHCGTVACAVGHGPTIRGLEARASDHDWEDYCERVFGVGFYSATFDFLFGPNWALHDNTPHGAAKRIRYVLANGLPDPEDFYKPEIYADA